MKRDEFKRTAKLPDEVRRNILDRLDHRAGADSAASPPCNEQRIAQRFSYRVNDVAVIIDHPGGGSSRWLLFSRNLSTGGASFIHNAFCHNGSPCRVLLRRNDGQGEVVSATIVSCRHITGVLHEIGVKFASAIDITTFIAPQDQLEHATGAQRDDALVIVDANAGDEERTLIEHILTIGERAGTMLTSLAHDAPLEQLHATVSQLDRLRQMADEALQTQRGDHPGS